MPAQYAIDPYKDHGQYQIIEVATGEPVAQGQSYGYAFAKYVRDVRDAFNRGDFILKPVDQPKKYSK